MAENLGHRAGCIAMQVVEKPTMEQIRTAVEPRVERNQFFRADGWGAYGILSASGHKVKIEPIAKERLNIDHKWVHIAISLAKRFLLGTYHGVSGKHLQAYLDEFCYRFNRRFFGNRLVHRLLLSLVSANPVPYAALTG